MMARRRDAAEPMPRESAGQPPLAELLERERPGLVRFLERAARGLLRYESAEDLAQAVHLQALEARDRLAWRGEEAFRGWLHAIARQVIARRHEHWRALKRNAAHVLRISAGGASQGSARGGVDPAGARTGPVTLADRREQLALATQALATLLPRDQEIVRLVREGAGTAQLAAALAISPGAAERARERAFDRFERAFSALRRARRV